MSITKRNELAGAITAAQAERDALDRTAPDYAEQRAVAIEKLQDRLHDLEVFDRTHAGTADERDLNAVPAARGRVSVAREVATHEGLKAISEGRQASFGVERDIYVGNDDSDGSAIGRTDYTDLVVRPGMAAPTIFNWLEKVPTLREVVEYRKRVSYTRNASDVAKRDNGDFVAVPRSEFKFESATVALGKIGDSFRTSRDAIADEPMLEAEIRDLLNYSIPAAVADRLLAATDVSGSAVKSIRAAANGTQAYGLGSDANETAGLFLDALLDARVSARLAGQALDGWSVVTSPLAEAELLKLKDSNGIYRVGSPFATSPSGLVVWGMPVVTAEQMVGTAATAGALDETLVLPQHGAVRGWIRRGIEITSSENVDDDFLKDAIQMKATIRMAADVINGDAIVTVDGSASGS